MPAWEIAAWPPKTHLRLLNAGLLCQASDAQYVLCPECRDHYEELIAGQQQGVLRYYVPCPQVLRADVPPQWRKQWTVHLECLAAALATTLGLSGRYKELVPGRLWRLGRTDWHGASRDVMFARGLCWSEAREVRAEIVRGRKAIVFVAQQTPPDDFWLRRRPPVIPLSEFTSLGEDQIEIEALAVATAIRDADEAPGEGLVTVTEQQLKLMIRQQVKAESKSELTDDILIAAYRHSGAYRSAAEFLGEQTGQEVSKDAVYRAVQRAGGILAVLNSEDSNSVVRGVAAQRRDKRGKNLQQAKPVAEK
jgi:hypothetical protein